MTWEIQYNVSQKQDDNTNPILLIEDSSGNEKARFTSAGDFSLGGGAPGGFADLFKSASGAAVDLLVRNTSNTSSSDAKILAQTAGDSAGNPHLQLQISGIINWFLGADNADQDKLKISNGYYASGGSTFLTITTGGSVGIGTTSPGQKLHVHDGTNSVYLKISSPATNKDASLHFNDGSNNWYVGMLGEGGLSDNFSINRNGGGSGMKLTIDASGNVGIGTGTGSVGAKLDIRDSEDALGFDLKVSSQATSGDQGVNSPKLSLTGSGWTGAVAEYRNFYFKNVVTNATSTAQYRLGIFNHLNSELLQIRADGQITIPSGGDFIVDRAVTVNEGGWTNGDFRAEGDTLTHLLFLDASEDKIGINTNSFASGDFLVIKATNNNGTTRPLKIVDSAGTALFNFVDNGGLGINVMPSGVALDVNGKSRFSQGVVIGSSAPNPDSTGLNLIGSLLMDISNNGYYIRLPKNTTEPTGVDGAIYWDGTDIKIKVGSTWRYIHTEAS